MLKYRQHIIFRVFWLVMAIHIINCSVDAPDTHANYVSEDLSYNDMESIAEILLEQVFGIENAIAEHEEYDPEGGYSFNINKETVYYYQIEVKNTNIFNKGLLQITSINYIERYFLQFHPEIEPPPPKV